MCAPIVIATVLLMRGAGDMPAVSVIDLAKEWRFRADPQDVGLAQGWQALSYPDHEWAVIEAGKRWEDQGYVDVDGVAWYRRRVTVPASWAGDHVWLVLGGANDSCTVFCNGQRVNSFGDETERSVAAVPVIAELSRHVRPGEPNVLAIRFFDWGASGGIWRLPCLLTTDPADLPLDSLFACNTQYDDRRLTVDFDTTGLGNDPRPSTIWIELRGAADASEEKAPLDSRSIALGPDEWSASASFELPDAVEGSVYRVLAAAEDADGRLVAGMEVSADVEWPARPAWSGKYASLKVLNNFVTELLGVDSGGQGPGRIEHTFLNPRRGWVFISIDGAGARADQAQATLDGEAERLVWRPNPDTGALEAMRILDEGGHSITVEAPGRVRLVIRAVPELSFCYYPATPHIRPFGPYDWAYVERHVLPHVNVLVTRGSVPEDEFATWVREGRQWVSNAGLPGLSSEEPPLADDVYAYWAGNRGSKDPGFAGLIVDEFLWSGEEHYRAWGEAVRRLHETPGFEDRTFYAWCGDLFGSGPSLEFSRLLQELGHLFVWEKYLCEQPTPEETRRYINREVQHALKQWQEAMPGVERHIVMCLGYLCAPPETQNLDPSVDYQVFMDMQFHVLATEPVFWGLHGVMEYMSDYADEESLRWAHKLFRHYCIEGNRTPLATDPFNLVHLANPDFADGLASWDVENAEEGAISVDSMEGFAWLQGRYPDTGEGDRFCRMRRSAKGPNRVRQTIQALEPGRLYSVKLISADVGLLHEKQTLALSVAIDGAEILDEFCFQFAYPSCYSHEVGPYTRENPAHFNFHRVVFRAKAERADLTIADWKSAEDPGGPVGQETAFNFVEVQPFHAP